MKRCEYCRSDDLDKVEYVETSLFGESSLVIIVSCRTCGATEVATLDTVATPG